ncbi:IucA/IucC family siderophore biosynthesis protein [Legionella taurinensis]|uniref:IucA/IucC family siderophore biosynthesis protein n=1 Tax=Legionella taurinensis TaxID=70611 RepID=A0AB38N393_9GAMM|nr:IucA/IucC family protein [Legionella taurinensis]MDX1837778.1 IucA/IucC family protein [Legionella taurinensis]PUT39716.1 IucA/IucC family siderophore biosynthesis protein [Legionella taurinensis]PUT43409.1 IucA/IucC family siderophore biosynthesis protein [Legionella taurinensis]PUT45854.1 IucA/IucC family siderophore biosynthesis protein [Legionella taurinensis]PUT47767.1 IucA/IucC family siderophore biosynthesis protein [Legionella taurinensis]
MALAYGNFHDLSHQLRFLLFEVGIGLPQNAVDHYITVAHRDCLQRLKQAAIMEQLGLAPPSHHVHDWLDLLKDRMKQTHPASAFYHWQDLRQELNESIANEALALAYRQRWEADLKRQLHGRTFWNWLNQRSAQESTGLLEQWGCTGHPYHPNFRCKMGFNRREVMQYSPEFNAQVAIHWGALRRDRAHVSHGRVDYQSLLQSQFPHEYQRWRDNLCFKQMNPEDYYPLPIHPWQWRNKIQSLCAELLDNKELLLIPHHQLTRPSMSFRTMMTQGDKSGHLKLAAAVHTTSALRTVSPASVDNGPVLSSWIKKLLQDQDDYRGTLFLAGDLAGININHSAIPAHQRNQAALLLRENPVVFVQHETQRLIPLAALLTQSPAGPYPLLLEIIEASGLSLREYFTVYCRLVLASQLHLMMRYGIAMESHQQNTLIRFDDHLPSAVVVRDLGGIRLSTHPVYDHVAKPRLHPDSTLASPELDGVCDKFIHGNLQSNLAHVIAALNQQGQVTACELWQRASAELKRLFAELAPAVPADLADWYYQKLLVRPWPYKNLLSMRLQGNQDDLFSFVANPLSAFS